MKQTYLYDRLMNLPLFQGIGRSDFYEMVERIRLGFRRQPKGYFYVRQDETCNSLRFIMDGEVCVHQESLEHNFTLSEWLSFPMVIQPECLFGLSTRYTRSFQAVSMLQTLEIDKASVRDVLFLYPTFQINFLNMISTRAQYVSKIQGRLPSDSLYGRFLNLVSERCIHPAGHKEIKIGMNTLSDYLYTSRLGVSKMLNQLANENKIILNREHIIIPKFELLLNS